MSNKNSRIILQVLILSLVVNFLPLSGLLAQSLTAKNDLCQGAYFSEEQGAAFLKTLYPASLQQWMLRRDSVIVQIKKGAGCAPVLSVTGNAARGGDVFEFELTLVPEESSSSHGGDKEVGPPVVVDVTHGNSHSIKRNIDAGSGGHLGEVALAVVTIQSCGADWGAG